MSRRLYLLGLLLCGAVAVLGQSSSASLNPSSSSASTRSLSSSGSGSQSSLVRSRSGSSAPVTAASSSSGPLSSVLTTTSSQQASGTSDSSSSTSISSSSSAGLAPCPVGKTCCANLVEQRTEICPFAVGVCCQQGGDQLAGYCCPPGSKCISEHFNDGKQSGLNQFRVSCMRDNGKVQLFKLPPASKTLTFEEEQKLLENLAKAQDAASDGEVHGAPNPYRGSSGGGPGLTPEQQAEKKRQDDEKKRAAKLAKMQKKGLKLKKINFKKPTVVTVLDNENSVAKDEEPKSDLPPAPKFTQEELDNILSGAGHYVAPVPTLPPAPAVESSSSSSSSSASEASAASTKASSSAASASVSAKSSEGSEGSEAASEASESGSK